MKQFLVLFSLLFLFFLNVTTAFAHVLKTDGSIGAVLHIDPNDDPIADSPTTFYFEIKDKQNKFTPQNCNCRVDIYQSGKIIYSDALFQTNSTNNISAPVFSYTFPERDVYQVKAIGSPVHPGDFQAFTLTYDVRVARQLENTKTNSSISYLPYLILGGIIVLLVIFVSLKRR